MFLALVGLFQDLRTCLPALPCLTQFQESVCSQVMVNEPPYLPNLLPQIQGSESPAHTRCPWSVFVKGF